MHILCIYTCMRTYIHIYIYAYMHVLYIYIYIYTYIHIYIYTYMRVFKLPSSLPSFLHYSSLPSFLHHPLFLHLAFFLDLPSGNVNPNPIAPLDLLPDQGGFPSLLPFLPFILSFLPSRLPPLSFLLSARPFIPYFRLAVLPPSLPFFLTFFRPSFRPFFL